MRRPRNRGREMVFGWYIIAYLFAAGAGSGAFFVGFSTCLWDVVRQSPASERAAASVQTAFYSAPVLCLFAVLLLMLDLGNPNRILPLVLNPFSSVIGVGAWLLALFILFSGALAIASLGARPVPRPLFLVLGVPALACAAGIMSYTGVLLSSLVSIDFWHTPWLVALFIASSLTAGAAVVVLGALLQGTPTALRNLQGLWKAFFLFTLAEAVLLAAFMMVQAVGPQSARDGVQLLVAGSMAPAFWGAVVAAGFAAPWAVHLAKRLVGPSAALVISSAGVLVGAFALRYCIVGAGLYSPLVLSSVAPGL